MKKAAAAKAAEKAAPTRHSTRIAEKNGETTEKISDTAGSAESQVGDSDLGANSETGATEAAGVEEQAGDGDQANAVMAKSSLVVAVRGERPTFDKR